MGFRDDMIALADEMRGLAAGECFERRLHTVIVRTRTWAGGSLGVGAPTDSDLTLDPVPQMLRPEPFLRHNEGGAYADGDILLRKISRTYTAAQLGWEVDLVAGVEMYWIVDGNEPFHLISLEDRYTQWRAHLRRKRGRT